MKNSNQLYVDLLSSRIQVDSTLAQIDQAMLTSSETADERQKKLQSLISTLDQKLEGERQAIANYIQVIRIITGPKAGEIKRSAFNALSPSARMLFIDSGGKVVN